MKKILFLLLSTVAMYGQVPADATPLENIQITNNTQSTTATKVNVQENDGTINTISKSDLVNYLEFASAVNLPVTGEQGKLYLTKDNNRLYRFNGTIYQELTTDISGLQSQIDLKANDYDVVKLTGDQTINGYKTFGNSLKVSTFNPAETGITSFSDSRPGVIARSNTSTALLAESVSGPAATFNTTSGGSIVRFIYGFNEKAYIDINGGYVKPSAPATNILLAGGSDMAQNTAFNKNFGTTAGTVVEGGTLGSNAYTSTAYLPLTGGIINGSLTVQNSNYTTFSVKGINTGNNGGGLIRFENQDTLFGEIAVETESAGNGVIYLRSLTNGAKTQKASIASSGAATFSGTVTASGGFFNSDRRLKNIFKRDGDVAYYTWKDGRDTKEHIGYVAQEVQEKHPNQVQADEKGMLSVNYVEILVEKIRILEKRIEQLEKSK